MEKWGKEELTDRIIKACIKVHTELGPGYLENIYHNALVIELPLHELSFGSEKEVRVYYLGKDIGIHKIDFLVAADIIVELKAVDELHKKHYAQVRSSAVVLLLAQLSGQMGPMGWAMVLAHSALSVWCGYALLKR